VYCHSNAISWRYLRACSSGVAGNEPGLESGSGDPRPRKRWDKKGRKTCVTKNGFNKFGSFEHLIFEFVSDFDIRI